MSGDVVDVKVDTSSVDLKLDEMPGAVRTAVLDAVIADGAALTDLARTRAETLLQVRTGKFVSRIRFGLRRSKNRITGRVYSTAKTANLFEWGGTTPPHEIAPDSAKALLLQMRGGSRFAAHVHHPGGYYKRLEIIHGAFDQMKPEIQAALEGAANAAAARASA